mgnify:CR=1 FL=1
MDDVKRLYNRSDARLRSLSQSWYAVFLGAAGGTGVLIAGLVISAELLVVQAVTMAVVLFGLEYTFGLHQRSDDADET